MNLGKSPVLEESVLSDSPLKEWLLEYVGTQLKPENGEVTVEMIVEVVAKEFPQFLLAVAEENFIRGYHQAFVDIETGREMANAEQENQT
tara:strand:+ start:1458 stop:1727 length:270 start_codon:yes stop_codon:yes gene_type:complete